MIDNGLSNTEHRNSSDILMCKLVHSLDEQIGNKYVLQLLSFPSRNFINPFL